ncbi:hypothetical protein Droror1_Dr00006236 [Drosera rotundifolia]
MVVLVLRHVVSVRWTCLLGGCGGKVKGFDRDDVHVDNGILIFGHLCSTITTLSGHFSLSLSPISDSSPSSSSTLSLTLSFFLSTTTTTTTSSSPSFFSLIDVFVSRCRSPLRLSLPDYHHCLNSINQNKNSMSLPSPTTTTTATIQPLFLLTTHLRPWRLLLSLSSLSFPSGCSPMVGSGLADQIKPQIQCRHHRPPPPQQPPSPYTTNAVIPSSITSIFSDKPPPPVTGGTNPLASPEMRDL